MKKKGFTLMELLVVMLIISILLGLLTAAVRKSVHYANERRMNSDQRTLEAAFRAFRHEYGKWPLPSGSDQVKGEVRCSGAQNPQVIENLRYDNRDVNTHRVRFINEGDYVRDTTNIVDAIVCPLTGKPYVFVFDLDNDSCSVRTNVYSP